MSELAKRQNLYKVSAQFIELQSKLFGNKLEGIDEKINEMKKNFGGIGTTHYLEAVHLMRQGKREEAAAALAKAAELAPSIAEFTALFHRHRGENGEQQKL